MKERGVHRDLMPTSQPRKNQENEGWRLLANAVIMQAIRDVIDERMSFREFCRWVRSDHFRLLSRECVSPDAVIKEVWERVQKKYNR